MPTREPVQPRMKPVVEATTTMFGRYKLLGRIGEGGMAEVFRALMTGPEGFERELVLKRILPRLSETGDFKTMFIREAKISALLLHPNIVQIYEFGEAEGAYFIAMENVQGVTLREALTTLRREQRAMPYLVAADIARQICIGLDYAHTLHGPDGRALEIVHQDISPTNIMLAYTGTVKILDFGIARAASFAEEEAKKGLIKGKVSYLSPEQIHVRPFDARADVFALGVVFHEMLTGRRLFQAKNDIGKMRQLLSQPFAPPSSLNATIPRELDRIVMRALSIDVTQRFQSAADMASDLERTLIAARYSSRELSKLLHGLFLPNEDPVVVVDTDDHRTVAMTGTAPGSSSGTSGGASGQTGTATSSGSHTPGARSTSTSHSHSTPGSRPTPTRATSAGTRPTSPSDAVTDTRGVRTAHRRLGRAAPRTGGAGRAGPAGPQAISGQTEGTGRRHGHLRRLGHRRGRRGLGRQPLPADTARSAAPPAQAGASSASQPAGARAGGQAEEAAPSPSQGDACDLARRRHAVRAGSAQRRPDHPLGRSLGAAKRELDLFNRRLELRQSRAILFEDLGRRATEEVRIAELPLQMVAVLDQLGEALLEIGPLHPRIDDPLQRNDHLDVPRDRHRRLTDDVLTRGVGARAAHAHLAGAGMLGDDSFVPFEDRLLVVVGHGQLHLEARRGRDLLLGADAAHGDDDLLHQRHRRLGGVVVEADVAHRVERDHDALGRARRFGELLPDLFGEERHERMQQAHRRLQRRHQRPLDLAARLAIGLRVAGELLEAGLGEFDVPVAQLVPDEVVGGLGGVGDPILLERAVHLLGDPLNA